MAISQLILAQLWLYAFFLGTGLGAVYDVFSIVRVFLGVPFTPLVERLLSTEKNPFFKRPSASKNQIFNTAIKALLDFLFSFGAFCLMILLFYQQNEGRIRIHAILCLVTGFFLYRVSLCHFLRPCLELILLSTVNLVRYTICFLIFPFHAVFMWGRKKLLHFYRKCSRGLEKKKRFRYTKMEEQRLKEKACGMLLQIHR